MITLKVSLNELAALEEAVCLKIGRIEDVNIPCCSDDKKTIKHFESKLKVLNRLLSKIRSKVGVPE